MNPENNETDDDRPMAVSGPQPEPDTEAETDPPDPGENGDPEQANQD